jgi:hypothetical protein
MAGKKPWHIFWGSQKRAKDRRLLALAGSINKACDLPLKHRSLCNNRTMPGGTLYQ